MLPAAAGCEKNPKKFDLRFTTTFQKSDTTSYLPQREVSARGGWRAGHPDRPPRSLP